MFVPRSLRAPKKDSTPSPQPVKKSPSQVPLPSKQVAENSNTGKLHCSKVFSSLKPVEVNVEQGKWNHVEVLVEKNESQQSPGTSDDPVRTKIQSENCFEHDRSRSDAEECDAKTNLQSEDLDEHEKSQSGAEECDDPVKSRSEEQRLPEPGEPVCVICGRYGEYICDETDDDVCSLECKEVVLEKAKLTAIQTSTTLITPRPTTYTNVVYLPDDCIYVKDSEQRLPEWRSKNNVSKQQAERLRQEIDVQVTGDSVPAPVMEFSDCIFPPKLESNLESAGFALPTPVQMQAIPVALKGRDMLVRADTGSGKTASFLLPIIAKCSLVRSRYVSDREKPLAIVMTPTRELCSQVEEQAKVFGKGLPFKTALVVGGDALVQQVYRLKQGIELIVGTPGRLVDLLTKHPIDLDHVCIFVLDEVDTMLERGFRDQVMTIVRALSQPQIMMFSATVPPSTETFANSLLRNPIFITVGKPNLPTRAVKQTVIWVESNKKKQKLFDILQSATHYQPPVVVFVNSRVGADLLADAIGHVTGLKTASLHGEKQMLERRQVLSSFLTGELPVVVATGVLGRGLDLIKVKQVIVFDMPSKLEEYIHQIGRASRLGMPGTAIVFINNEDKGIFKSFVDLLQSSGAVVPKQLANSPYVHSSYAAAYSNKKQKR